MRQLRRSAVVALAFAILALSTAEAGQTLHTAPASRYGRIFQCRVVNAAPRPVTVTTYIVNVAGIVEAMFVNEDIDPDTVGGTAIVAGEGTGVLFCKFTVTGGSKTQLRGSYCVADATGLVCEASGDAR